ncbi:hypothetical protein SLA2020_002110 [Shorea laevis]
MERARVRVRDAATREGSFSRRRQGQTWWNERFRNKVSESTTVFFFYNFPEELAAADLWRRFKMHGRVVDVYVPAKRDKRGKRFGFVRILGVQNVYQMEKRLNGIWFGSYKLRVKVAEDRQQSFFANQRTTRVAVERRTEQWKDSLVRPQQSYAQAAEGKNQRFEGSSVGGRQDKALDGAVVIVQPVQNPVLENEEAVSGVKKGGDKTDLSSEDFIEFSPEKEENKWLDGSMVAEVKSLAMITGIQARLDVDGGCITLSPLGGRRVLLTEKIEGILIEYIQQNKELIDMWFVSILPWVMATQNSHRMVWLRISGVPLKAWTDRCFQMIAGAFGEVILVHDDTKTKAILCDGRVMILSLEMGKISKVVNMKVDDQMYEIRVAEEEWRSDPDWWLSECDRKSTSEDESEYSLSQNMDEDLDLMNYEIQGADVGPINEEVLKKASFLNSKENSVTVVEEDIQREQRECCGVGDDVGPNNERSGGVDEVGPNKERIGPIVRELDGLENDGKMDEARTNGLGHEKGIRVGQCNKSERVNGEFTEEIRSECVQASDVLLSRKQRDLEDCDLQNWPEIGEASTQWVTARSKQREERRKKAQQDAEERAVRAGSGSLSDGCIAHRNQVIQKEMSINAVKKILSVGKRLGIQLHANEEEVESRLMVAERRDARQGS